MQKNPFKAQHISNQQALSSGATFFQTALYSPTDCKIVLSSYEHDPIKLPLKKCLLNQFLPKNNLNISYIKQKSHAALETNKAYSGIFFFNLQGVTGLLFYFAGTD